MSELSLQDRHALAALLDQLCEYEESAIECATVDGDPGRDAIQYHAVRRSRRVWRRAQQLMIKLEDSGPVPCEINRALVEACREQHHAIDWLLARLIGLDPDFFPSNSPAWPAIVHANAAIEAARAVSNGSGS